MPGLEAIPPSMPNKAGPGQVLEIVNNYGHGTHGKNPVVINTPDENNLQKMFATRKPSTVGQIDPFPNKDAPVPPVPSRNDPRIAFLLPYRDNLAASYGEFAYRKSNSLANLLALRRMAAQLHGITHGGWFARNDGRYTPIQLDALRTVKNAYLMHRSLAMTVACLRQEIIAVDACIRSIVPQSRLGTSPSLPANVTYDDPMASARNRTSSASTSTTSSSSRSRAPTPSTSTSSSGCPIGSHSDDTHAPMEVVGAPPPGVVLDPVPVPQMLAPRVFNVLKTEDDGDNVPVPANRMSLAQSVHVLHVGAKPKRKGGKVKGSKARSSSVAPPGLDPVPSAPVAPRAGTPIPTSVNSSPLNPFAPMYQPLPPEVAACFETQASTSSQESLYSADDALESAPKMLFTDAVNMPPPAQVAPAPQNGVSANYIDLSTVQFPDLDMDCAFDPLS